MTWDSRFMALAALVAGWSKDPSTQVGCVVVGADRTVLATGYNGFPRGCDDSAALYADRQEKHLRTVHAEANAVAASSRTGASLKGGTAYVTAPPCAQCAALLVQAGIARVVVPAGATLRPDWQASMEAACALLNEAGMPLDPQHPWRA